MTFLSALAVSLVGTGLVLPVLRKRQLLDVPNHRSSHTRPVPRGGGVAVVLALCIVSILAGDRRSELWILLLVVLLLSLLGLWDDVRPLPSGIRLAAQLTGSIVLAVTLLMTSAATWWWLPALIVGIVGYVNAFNFMDGVNGISALTASAVGGWWAWAGHSQQHQTLETLGLVLAGVAAGFLPWNAPRAKVFLGDVGSYGLGVFIAGLSAVAVTEGLPWHWAVAPLAVYGADTGWVLVKRFRGHRPLTQAHREHVYQRLVDGGWSHLAGALLCAGAGALVCFVVGLPGLDLAWWSVLVAVGVILFYLNAPRALILREGAR